jgi:hypothetical protein
MTDPEDAADIERSDELLRTIAAVLNIRAVFPQVDVSSGPDVGRAVIAARSRLSAIGTWSTPSPRGPGSWSPSRPWDSDLEDQRRAPVPLDLEGAFTGAGDLSRAYTGRYLTRSLDLLHA